MEQRSVLDVYHVCVKRLPVPLGQTNISFLSKKACLSAGNDGLDCDAGILALLCSSELLHHGFLARSRYVLHQLPSKNI